ncbi:hypothetical protein AXE80_12055 [Wenyingzhuangia fucanilytica]|uniref:Uncharacterized protein n=1 Tax=Wenyingzhuangia fucanilytica TaxID=1790137 RepID=A0A1B1Y874_9FLAO|nr:hypothetical protein [Wenyingzhuangia fucanilytica]ANW96966.1 hypothetical protein AXE80_12055 [Wenyingzhuangia fucanilytica]
MKNTYSTNNTSRNPIILLILVWFVLNVLLLLSATNFLAESFFQKEHLMVCFIMIGSALATLKVCLDHYKYNG